MPRDSSNGKAQSSELVPMQWPPEVVRLYEPVRELGRGGFASVLLARSKKNGSYCAMKVVGSKDTTRKEIGYACREIDILQELSHPNIMVLLDHWERPADSHTCAAVMALSYAEGPTLEWLLKRGGKLSIKFARVVAAQLIDALAYLHSRAVVHRDVSPANITVTGASEEQDDIWDDLKEDGEPDWKALRQRWHITLLDFGFARALTPDDLKKATPKHSSSGRGSMLDNSTGSTNSLSKSISKRFGRKMSALGTKLYAAPEVVNGVQGQNDIVRDCGDTSKHAIDVTKTLSEHVSFYGLMADAYSAGNTIKYMMTGVSPDENVADVIALENNPVIVVCRLLGNCLASKDTASERKVEYRPIKDIPKEALRLIKGLTNPDPLERTSIRTARLYPWIDDVLEGCPVNYAQKPDYLSFALKIDKGEVTEEKKSAEVQAAN